MFNELYGEMLGSKDPCLILHGGPGLGFSYLRPGMDPLAKRYTCIFYDQRGAGRSAPLLSSSLSPLDQYIEDIEMIRTLLDLNKFTLLAHSWGGFLAAAYAAKYPEYLSKMILISSVPLSYDDYQAYRKVRAKAVQASTKPVDDSNPKAVSNYYKNLFTPYFFNSRNADKLDMSMTKEAAKQSFSTYALFIDRVMSRPFNYNNVLKQLHLPTVIIHGKQDLVPIVYAQDLANTISNAAFYPLDQCGHFPYLEQGEKFFEILNKK